MPRKIEAYFGEILESIEAINSYVKGMDFGGYTKDGKTKAAVERKLLIIGEALNQMKGVNPDFEKKVTDFRKIVGFRNILVLGYFGIDDALVWDVVTNKMAQLKVDIKKL